MPITKTTFYQFYAQRLLKGCATLSVFEKPQIKVLKQKLLFRLLKKSKISFYLLKVIT
jgi:hypothetical protein